jgi:transposase
MSRRFRTCDLNQLYLLPPSLNEWLPEDHLARFVAAVTDELDLGAISSEYERRDGRGVLGYHPVLLTRVLLYAYAVGITSSRRIEKATYEDLGIRYLAADQHPDHDTIAAFRQRHLEQLAALFTQALEMCRRAGLAKLGNVAIDGTKLQANASRSRSFSYERLSEQEKRLKALVEEMLATAEQTDKEEDERYGQGRLGDELPPELCDAKSRLEKIRAAKKELEQEAAEQLAKAEREHPGAGVIGRPGKSSERAQVSPEEAGRRKKQLSRAKKNAARPSRQYNLTDPESRILRDSGKATFVQGYNAQAAVDSTAQVIVAADVTQQVIDRNQLAPMCAKMRQILGEMPAVITADAGYWNMAAVAEVETQGVDVLVAPEAMHRWATPRRGQIAEAAQRMREKIGSAAGKALYRMRRCTVEAVFGQIKSVRRLDRFSFRGLRKVQAEWQLFCLTHNLLKLYRAKMVPLPS